MSLRIGRYHVRIDLGHLLFLTTIAGYCLWYLVDSRAASTSLQNLLLIEPIVIVAVLLVIALLPSVVSVQAAAGPEAPTPEPRAGGRRRPSPDALRILASMALLGAYVAVMTDIGFDAATFLFVSGSLLLLGERRPSLVVALPLAFTAVTVYGFKLMLSLPIPTLLF